MAQILINENILELSHQKSNEIFWSAILSGKS